MDILIVILFIFLINAYIINALSNKFDIASEGYLWLLFTVHFLLTIAYLLYAYFTASDSVNYYDKSLASENWFELFETGTSFIYFLAWPFVVFLGLKYYATMILFSYFGYLAVVLFYIAARENIKINTVWRNYTAIELLFLLPNLHFWSSSLGKGSSILFGLGLFIYGLSRFNKRPIPLVIGGLLTFFIRPHIFFTLMLSVMIGIFITSSGIKPYLKWLIFLLAMGVFIYISDDVLKFADVESFDVTNSEKIMHRATELGKSSSGVNIQEYGIAMKMFTFWFRPLFIDGQGVFGFIVSFENLLYVYMFIILIKQGFLTWYKWNGWFRICVFIFILGSFILAQVSGNLGIAMRQKAQFMPFFFILYCKAISYRESNSL
jgi:hypothetical protein